MSTYERSKWCLWTLSLLTQSLFLVATQVFDTGSSVVWATGAPALVFVLLTFLVAFFDYWQTRRATLVNLLFVSGAPASTLVMLAWNDVTWTVPWASFEGLCAGLMACWAVFDMVVLKPALTPPVRFDDVVADAKRNSGLH